MAKVILIGAESPENWGWEKNPINDQQYELEDIPGMYGDDFYDFFIDTDHFINSWEVEEWTPDHGHWIFVDGKEATK